MKKFTASIREDWGVELLSVDELYYNKGADPDGQRPRHVRAGSGLTSFGSTLVGVQDDADFLAFIDPDEMSVRGSALDAGSASHRLYDDREETADAEEKVDLEACLVVPGDDEATILSFGSGVSEARRRLVLTSVNGDIVEHSEYVTRDLHQALADPLESRGGALNVEGAVFFPSLSVLRIFSRGDHGENPFDATMDISWEELKKYLEQPLGVPVPRPFNLRRYELGALNGRPLTFSDAERVGDGCLVTVSSESDDEAGGSLIGFMDSEGELVLARGDCFPVEGKLEGISFLSSDPARLFAIEDQDDFEKASRLYELKLVGDWPGRLACR
jgi:hypothetical protein